jgi:hypothetical protein
MKKEIVGREEPAEGQVYGSGRKDDILTHLSKIILQGSAWSGKSALLP